MSTMDPVDRDELWWADPELKERLRQDPFAVLSEQGINAPPNLPIDIVREIVRIVSLIWQDGQVITRRRFVIDPGDEGILFGRGLWESTRTFGGIPWLWPMHIARLRHTAALVGMDLEPERLPDSEAVLKFVRSLTAMDVVVRLNVTPGSRGRPGTIWMSAVLPPVPVASFRLQCIRTPIPKGHPYLVWKTFQYATRLRLGQEGIREGFDSTLLLDAADNVLEAAHANIFLRIQDGWATPEADGGLLPGTVRQHLLDHAPVPIRERKVPKSSLAGVKEAFLTNSNTGIVPVTRIDDNHYPIGDETRNLIRWLHPPWPT